MIDTDKLIVGILCLIAGALFVYIIVHVELDHLKDQLAKAEEDNEKIIKENARLRAYIADLKESIDK